MAKPVKKTSKNASSKPTMRELGSSGGAKRRRSLKSRSSFIGKPFKRLKRSNKKDRKIVQLPDNRLGRILDSILFSLPRYIKGAWGEIRQTTWPSRKETIRLTFAVFIFSSIFAAFVAILDFALDKIFKHLITK